MVRERRDIMAEGGEWGRECKLKIKRGFFTVLLIPAVRRGAVGGQRRGGQL